MRMRGGREKRGVDIKSEQERKGGVGRHSGEGEVKRCMYVSEIVCRDRKSSAEIVQVKQYNYYSDRVDTEVNYTCM